MKQASRLSDQQLAAMRQHYINGMTITDIAKKFNVSRVTVNNHSNTKVGGKNGKTWKQLKAAREEKYAEEYETRSEQNYSSQSDNDDIDKEDSHLSKDDQERIKQLKRTIKDVNRKLKLPKIKPSEFIALSKYRTELQEEMYAKDKVYIIPPPLNPTDEEFEA
jgi:predicted DNA-binding protein YlxM (UPF0122 family)